MRRRTPLVALLLTSALSLPSGPAAAGNASPAITPTPGPRLPVGGPEGGDLPRLDRTADGQLQATGFGGAYTSACTGGSCNQWGYDSASQVAAASAIRETVDVINSTGPINSVVLAVLETLFNVRVVPTSIGLVLSLDLFGNLIRSQRFRAGEVTAIARARRSESRGTRADATSGLAISLWVKGAGPYLSTDSGRTFTEATATPGLQPTAFARTSLAVGDDLLAGLQDGGVYRSTDGGRTFRQSSAGLSTANLTVYSVAASSDAVYAAADDGIYKSTDRGTTWKVLDLGIPGGLSASAVGARGATVYAGLYDPPGIWRSTDAGATWKEARAGLRAFDFYRILVEERTVWAATPQGLWRSDDGGANWRTDDRGIASTIVSAVLHDGSSLLVGTNGNRFGAYRSDDGGLTWSDGGESMRGQSVTGLATAGDAVVAGSAYFHPAVPYGLFRSTDHGTTWSRSQSGVGGPPSTLGLARSGSRILASVDVEGSDVTVYRSEDGGLTWTPSSTGIDGSRLTRIDASEGLAVGATPSGRLFRSTDHGSTWTEASKAMTEGYTVSALLVEGTSVLAGLLGTPAKSGLYRSSDSGTTWARLSAPTLLAGDAPTALAVTGPVIYAGYPSGLLYRSLDAGQTFTIVPTGAEGAGILSLRIVGGLLYIGTYGKGVLAIDAAPVTRRLVPIVLDVDTGSARFATELTLTNRGATDVAVTMTYTPSLGDRQGGGQVTATLPPGSLQIADAIATLRAKGLAIPASSAGQQGGTLLVSFEGAASPDLVSVTARTTAPTSSPAGSAGLAYLGLDPERDTVSTSLKIFGLRANATDRSNFAVFSTTPDPVTVSVTAYSGSGDGKSAVVDAALVLGPYEWKQFSFSSTGLASGHVVVRKVGGRGGFNGYGVINDNATNDGSFVFPRSGGTVTDLLKLPVLVETSAFRSELVLSNASAAAVSLSLNYTESLTPSAGAGGAVTIALAPGEQRILPDAIGALRTLGAAIGAAGAASYAGYVEVRATGAPLSDVYVGARTAAQGGGGQFGLFTPALYPGEEALTEAFLYGLRSDASNRSNVAVAHTGGPGSGAITLELVAYDGNAGGTAKGGPTTVSLEPGGWTQVGGFLARKGIASGWVAVRRTAGTASWLAYGVINDGASPGERTGDGAYVPMSR